jgi:tRNA A37 threonylcarbamoyladenosine biosynthesis protein TsaE
MANAEILKKYLVDEDNGYLLDSNNNGKVIMLSGKWGSGKTHFWKNIIATDNFKKELTDKNSAYSYVSLYGKSSIEEIENDIFAQTYFCAIGGDNLVTKTFSTFTKYSKRYGNLFSSFDFSKLADGLKEEQNDNKERIALERLKNGAIICFDDFERKSKDIDLTDLFGFITQLTLNFDCKVVIILNDDVFEGEEKKIFSNVKEKSVSKFLKYEPSIRDLFKSIIFEREKQDETKFKYSKLRKNVNIILKTIEETQELNARIYIQILDNLVEWIDKKAESNDDILRSLILINTNFILYHIIIKIEDKKYKIQKLIDEGIIYKKTNEILPEDFKSFEKYLVNYKQQLTYSDNLSDEKIRIRMKVIEDNITLVKSDYFVNKLDISKNVDDKTFQKINNFIETGIL